MSDNIQLKPSTYGEADFAYIRENGLAYVDKTQFIEALETCGSRYPFIVRPRRFGKTLSTSVLEAYYDEAAADRFEQVFAGTYIGAHKTALASKFRVFHLDFSGLASPNSTVLQTEFLETVKASVRQYFSRYPHPNQNEVLQENFPTATTLITRFFSLAAEVSPKKIYVIIDEYDQFANEILSEDLDHFKSITSSEGFFKNFFSKLKAATRYAVARIFITGVTSISLDSMTSGFNIATNYTTDPAFANLYGFTETELRELVPQILDLDRLGLHVDELISRMKEWYNGYRFSPYCETTVFNPTMCLSYLCSLQRYGKEPPSLLDPNLGQDLKKIENILHLGDRTFVKNAVERALRREPIPFSGALQTLNLNQQSQLDRESLLSAMWLPHLCARRYPFSSCSQSCHKHSVLRVFPEAHPPHRQFLFHSNRFHPSIEIID